MKMKGKIIYRKYSVLERHPWYAQILKWNETTGEWNCFDSKNCTSRNEAVEFLLDEGVSIIETENEPGTSKVSSLEKEYTKLCFEAEREACRYHRQGDMSMYGLYMGKADAYRTAARMAEKYFEEHGSEMGRV